MITTQEPTVDGFDYVQKLLEYDAQMASLRHLYERALEVYEWAALAAARALLEKK